MASRAHSVPAICRCLLPPFFILCLVPANMASNSPTENLQDDSDLLDENGNIKSAQPNPSTTDRLTNENFKIVREHSNQVRSLVNTRDSLRNFNSTTLRLYGQGIRPRWLGRQISPPVLPGSISLPEDFHKEWNSTLKKFECKLQKKLIKYLPTLLDTLDAEINKTRTEKFEEVRKLIQETTPGQQRRGEAVFLKLCSRQERVPLMGNRKQAPNGRSAGKQTPSQ